MNLLAIGGQEILIILVIVVILFGGKKIPELLKGVGKGVKEYKKAVNGIDEEIKDATAENTQSQPSKQPEADKTQSTDKTQQPEG